RKNQIISGDPAPRARSVSGVRRFALLGRDGSRRGCELGSRIAQRSGGSRGAAACNGNPRLPKLLVWEMSPPGITRLTPRKSAWRSNVKDETSLSISPALKQRAQRILVGLKSAG